ncbi:MAG: carboxypeptidase [Variovorax sp.]|jgi:glutamate carboxypeptidase|nr:carboxypeptidase [Variovorax sp.]
MTFRSTVLHLTLLLSIVTSGCSDGNANAFFYSSTLDQRTKDEQPAVLKTLEELVNIESGTNDAIGIPEMGNYLEGRLKALGAEVTRTPATSGVVGDIIVGQFKGSGGRHVLMMAHMDTVYVRGSLAKAPFRIDGDQVLGAGIADAKGGIATILHTLALLKAQSFQQFGTITVMFNTDEEKGSLGSNELIQKLAAQSDIVLSYETGFIYEGQEFFVTGTSGVAVVEARVHGKASHAGAASPTAVNSMTEAADLILRTQDLQDPQQERLFNWTTIKGGSATNIIPDLTVVSADMRYGRNEDLPLLEAALAERAQKKRLEGARIDLQVTRLIPPYNATDAARGVMNKAVAIYAEVGAKLVAANVRTGGGSDAGWAALSGKPVLENLGLPGGNQHADAGEYVLASAIPRRLYLSARLVSELGQGL